MLVVLLVAGYYIIQFFNKPPHMKYPAFGIDIPVNYAIHGVDVSRHQKNIDWNALKNMQDKEIRIGFAFIKATEGLGTSRG